MFDLHREEITLRLDAGRDLQDIERELVEPASLSEDDRAALWLYAWSYRERRAQSPVSAGVPICG